MNRFLRNKQLDGKYDSSTIDDMPRKCLVLDFFGGIGVIPPIPIQVLPWLGLSVPGSGKLVSTLENILNWIQRGQSRFLCICFNLNGNGKTIGLLPSVVQ